MKTRLQTQLPGRNPESGAIAVVVAFLWMTLFGLAAFAVDIGYQYTSKRGLQAAADAAVRAGMPSLRSSTSTAIANATAMATANGYTNGGGTTVTVSTPTGQQLQVTISITQPSFFLKIFGYTTRTMSATAIGQLLANNAPALHANSAGGCGVGVGVTLNGGGGLKITGDVEGGNGIVNYQTGPVTTNTFGTAKSPCPGYPKINVWDNVTGGTSATSTPDPFLGVTPAGFACTVGNLVAPLTIPGGAWTSTATSDTLAPGVYCSGGNLNVSGPGPSMVLNAPGVTFVALGQITIGFNNGGTMSPAPGAPRGIIAYSTANLNCASGTPAINLGFNNFVMNGSFYAPNGCINGGGTNMTLNGSMVGNEINLGDYGMWTIDSSGGGGGPTWTMYQ